MKLLCSICGVHLCIATTLLKLLNSKFTEVKTRAIPQSKATQMLHVVFHWPLPLSWLGWRPSIILLNNLSSVILVLIFIPIPNGLKAEQTSDYTCWDLNPEHWDTVLKQGPLQDGPMTRNISDTCCNCLLTSTCFCF